MKEIIIEGYDLSNQNFKGMTPEQYLHLMKFQNFTCPLSGKKFEHSRELKKFLDIEGRVTNVQAPPVDHDHETGFIRGILSEKVNLLLDQWEKTPMANFLNHQNYLSIKKTHQHLNVLVK